MSVPEIDADELATRLGGGVALLDVRQPEEYAQARLADSVLIPLGELADRLAEVPAGEPLVVICRSGNRSMRACEFLAAQGRDVANLRGGILAWVESGRPVDSGPGGG